jgi:hypothetical protein
MADPRVLKAKVRRFLVIGFCCGFAAGVLSTIGSSFLSNSELRLQNDVLFEFSDLCWRLVSAPAAILVSIVGADIEFYSMEPGPGPLTLMMITNGVLLGVPGMFAAWRIERAKWQKDSPTLSRAEKMLSEGVPRAAVYWRIVQRSLMYGGALGFLASLASIGLLHLIRSIFPGESGNWVAWLIWWFISQPAHILAGAFNHSWPDYNHIPHFAATFAASFINALVTSLFFTVVVTIMHLWIFFAPRKTSSL